MLGLLKSVIAERTVTTSAGNGIAGIGTLSTGHCHPRVVQAITEQAHKLVQGQQNQFLSSTAQARHIQKSMVNLISSSAALLGHATFKER